MMDRRMDRQMLLQDIGELCTTLPQSRYQEYLALLAQSSVSGGMDHQVRHLRTVYDALRKTRPPVYLRVDLEKLDSDTRSLIGTD